MAKRIGTEVEWCEIGQRVKIARQALMDVLQSPIGEIMSVRHPDAIGSIINQLDAAKSHMEDEMFRRGGPESTHVFYGPLDEDAEHA